MINNKNKDSNIHLGEEALVFKIDVFYFIQKQKYLDSVQLILRFL